jgi:nucleoside-diphosphate-sugar epimerase
VSGPVLITGAAGFIGSHLALRLAREGGKIRALDVKPAPLAFHNTSIQYHRVDLRQIEAVRAILDGVHTVFHLASAHLEVHARPEFFEQVNVAAAASLAEACAAASVTRLVHTSSVGVYGHVQQPPAAEDAPVAPRNAYERTKLAGEKAVLEVAARRGLAVIVLRPAWVYGPGCGRTAKLVRSLMQRRFVFIGDGCNLRHPLYIDDLVDAFGLASRARAELSGRVYNVAGPRPLSVEELVTAFARAVGVAVPRRRIPRAAGWALGRSAELVWGIAGREPPFSRRSLSFFDADNAFDTTAAFRDFGFVPQVELEEGLRRTLNDATWRFAA